MASRKTKLPRVPLSEVNPVPDSGSAIQVNHCRMPDCDNFGVPARTTPVKTGPVSRPRPALQVGNHQQGPCERPGLQVLQ